MIKLIFIIFLIPKIESIDYKNPNVKNGRLFELILDRFEIVNEMTSVIEWRVQIKKVNKTRAIFGYLSYHEPMGNNFQVKIEILKKQGGEHRYLPYKIGPGPFCDVFSKDEFIYQDLASQSDLPVDLANNCPISSGNYSFYGATSNLANAPILALQTGEYAGELSYFKDKQTVGIYRFYGYGTNYKKGRFFEIILDRFEIIHEDLSVIEWHAQIRKVNKTRSLIGFLTFHEPIGNNFIVGVKTLKKQGGEFRYLPYALPSEPFCDVLSNDVFFYPELAKQTDFPEDLANNCPLAPGNYSFHGANVNLDNAPTIVLQTGEYTGEVIYNTNGKDVAVYRLFFYVNST